nr:fibronectin type III domain-containing protein [Allomuricauda sp.]
MNFKIRLAFSLLFTLVFSSMLNAQNNLLDTSTWTVSSGSVPGYSDKGPSSSNVRSMDTGPHGTSELIWKSPANSTSDNDGGWDSDYVTIDPSKTYRFTVWIKRLNSLEGKSHFGLTALDASDNEATLLLNDTAKTNPYFESEPPTTVDDWYLLVGFVYGHGHTTGENGLEGVYDTAGNHVVTAYSSFKFESTAVKVRHRSYFREANVPAEQWFFGPTIYEVNGTEPSILDLINNNSGPDTEDPTAPTLTSTGNTDTTVDLSWSGAMDNVAVTGYKIFMNNNLLVTLGNVNNHTVTNLDPGTEYSFAAKALDAAGNESLASNLTVTTDIATGGGTVWDESSGNISYTAGNVGIGTTTIPTNYALAVNGKVISEEIKVQLQSAWPDYVFDESYEAPTLEEIKTYIENHGHLPNIPSAKEVEANGLEVGEMNRLLLEKIEELTLYTLEQHQQIQQLNILVREQQQKLEQLATNCRKNN